MGDPMKSKSMEEHKKNVPKSVKFGIITLSDSKYKDFLENKTTDISGNLNNRFTEKRTQISILFSNP